MGMGTQEGTGDRDNISISNARDELDDRDAAHHLMQSCTFAFAQRSGGPVCMISYAVHNHESRSIAPCVTFQDKQQTRRVVSFCPHFLSRSLLHQLERTMWAERPGRSAPLTS